MSINFANAKGIPFPGCGYDDAVYGYTTGGPKMTIDAAVKELRASVMKDRPRGWRPSRKLRS